MMEQAPGYPPPAPAYRVEDYLGKAFLALALYFFGFWFTGLIVNIIFLNNASRDRSMGIQTENVGCLQTLLWVQVILFVLSVIGMCVFMVFFGGLALLADPSNY